jgi:adenylate kinase
LRPGDQIFVILIVAEDSKVIDRLVGRLMCPGCGEIYNVFSRSPRRDGICDRCNKKLVRRSDDREDLIVERFRHYREETHPLVQHYRKAGCYFEVDGMRPINEVTRDILAIVDGEEKEMLARTPKGGKGSIA